MFEWKYLTIIKRHEIIDGNVNIVKSANSIKGHIRMQVRSING